MSKDEYDALVETSYLLSSPKNAQRLLSALEAAREGHTVEHGLIGALTRRTGKRV